jgi:hypothetical protein
MRRLMLTLAVAAALAASLFGATVVWGNAPQTSADDSSILWGT